jgi:magnesium-transporting ATPase (P-type)
MGVSPENGKKVIEWKKLKDGQDCGWKPQTKLQKYLPWEGANEGVFGVAITGPVLEYMNTKKKLATHVLPEVISKTQVYARMTPDHKAMLVKFL